MLPRCIFFLDIQLLQQKTYNLNPQMQEILYYKTSSSCETLIHYQMSIY